MFRTFHTKPESLQASLFVVFITIVMMFIVSITSAQIVINMFSRLPAGTSSSTANVTGLDFFSFLILVTPTVFLEELAFRVFPTKVICFFHKAFTQNEVRFVSRGLLLFVFVLPSLAFGYIHGNWVNVFIQGGSGYLLSLLFLKASGEDLSLERGLNYSFTAHFLFDFIIWAILRTIH